MFSYKILVADDREGIAINIQRLISAFLHRGMGLDRTSYKIDLLTNKNELLDISRYDAIAREYDVTICDMAWEADSDSDVSGMLFLQGIRAAADKIDKKPFTALYSGSNKKSVAQRTKEVLGARSPEAAGVDFILTKFDRNNVDIEEMGEFLRANFYRIRKGYFTYIGVEQAIKTIIELNKISADIRSGQSTTVEEIIGKCLTFYREDKEEQIDLGTLFPEEMKQLKSLLNSSESSAEEQAAGIDNIAKTITDFIEVRNKFNLLREIFVDDKFVQRVTHDKYDKEDFTSGRVKRDFEKFNVNFEKNIAPFLVVNEYMVKRKDDEKSVIRKFINDVENLLNEIDNHIGQKEYGMMMEKLSELAKNLKERFRFQMRSYFQPLSYPDANQLPTQMYCYRVSEGFDAIMQLGEPAVKTMEVVNIESKEIVKDYTEYRIFIAGEGEGIDKDLLEIFSGDVTGIAGSSLVQIQRYLATYFDIIAETKTNKRYQAVNLSSIPTPTDITDKIEEEVKLQKNGVRFSLRFSLVEHQNIIEEDAKGGTL